MNKKDHSKSKAQQVAELLSLFRQGEFSVSKIAKQIGLAESTVVQLARMNPGQCSVIEDEKFIRIIGEGGVASSVNHNVAHDGQLGTTFRGERHTRGKYSARGKGVINRNNGTS